MSRVDPATGEVTSYRSPVKDTDGIAVRGNRMVLSHRYHDRSTIVLSRAELIDDSWVLTGQEETPVPGRVVLRCGQGRDGVLWLRAGDTWVRVEA
ncbi:hypothetical protein ACWDYJ_11910 [Streptomyces sp. NPDC003042]